MLKWQKKNAEELIATIKEAHAALSQLLASPEGKDASDMLLSGCVQCTDALAALDADFNKAVNDYKAATADVKIPANVRLLTPFEDKFAYILKRIKPKLEVVFFSYKISMFDCFETVVRACNADPDIEAFVVPIPYFDKDNDVNLGERHFEDMRGIAAYSDLSILDYRQYDFKTRQPDIIFINNPYDDRNAVSSVHPDYYASNLALYTNLLVYIPYFVTLENENFELLVGRSFVETAACIHADRVFVQSENVRQSYIRHYRKVIEIFKNRDILAEREDKFVSVGSPKFEKVLAEKDIVYDIPDDWKRKIYYPDGRKKTVIFFNTGLSSMLFHSTDSTFENTTPFYLDKLESDLAEMSKHTDTVFIWRPHPLFLHTLLVGHPDNYNRFIKIRDNFIESDLGIYDLSEDFHPALSVSDAFYGDASSVGLLFDIAGKPALYSMPTTVGEKYFIDSYEKLDGEYFFTVRGFNKLFKTTGNTASVVADLPVTSDYFQLGFSDMTELHGKLYIVPETASDIVVYDIKSGETSLFDFDKTPIYAAGKESVKTHKFSGSFAIDDCVYIVGSSYPAIIKFNTVTGEKNYFNDYADKISQNKRNTLTVYQDILIENFSYARGFIHAVSYNYNGVIKINIETGETEFMPLFNQRFGFCAVSTGINFDFVTRHHSSTNIVRLNYHTKKYAGKLIIPEDFDHPKFKNHYFSRIKKSILFKKKIYLFPLKAMYILEYNLIERTTRAVETFDADYPNVDIRAKKTGGELVYSYYADRPHLTVIDQNGDTHRTEFDIDFKNFSPVIGILPVTNFCEPQKENYGYRLSEFISSIKSGMYENKKYFDAGAKEFAEFQRGASKRIIENCKSFLKDTGKY